MVLLRPSPNEEARILKEEREKRRKLRLQQVREQSKELAAKTRESVKAVKENEYHKLAQKLEDDFNEKKAEREKFLQELYLNSVRVLGEAHNNASQQSEQFRIESVKAKQKAHQDHKKAIQRHHEAMSHQQFELALKFQQENRHIFAKEKALAIERERAALVASLPTPQDPLAPASSNSFEESAEIMRTVPVIDYNGQVGTYFQQTSCFAQKEITNDQENAKEAAVREDEKQAIVAQTQMALTHEQNEKARLRGIAALNQVHLENEYESMCSKLEEMKQQDLQRRQQNVAKISKNIFLPPHRREEEKVQQQNAMENAFEKIYSSQPGVNTDELQLSSGDGEEKEDETESEEMSLQMSDSIANPLFGMIKRHGKDEASTCDMNNNTGVSSQDVQPPLKKLLAKINDQREQISRQSARVIEQYEPLVAVDETSDEQATATYSNTLTQDSVSRSTAQPDANGKKTSGSAGISGAEKVESKNVGSSVHKTKQIEDTLEDDDILPVPYEPEMLTTAVNKLKAKELDLSVEVPCRDTDVDVSVDKYGKNSFSEMEPIITSGPNFKQVVKSSAGVQVDSFDNTGFGAHETSDTRERDTSPVSRYLEAANKRELSTSSIEENLKKIREKNQKLLEKYNKVKERRKLGIVSDRSDGTSNTELSAPTRDVGLNRSQEKADVDISVNNDLPSTSKKVDILAENTQGRPLFVSPESQIFEPKNLIPDINYNKGPILDKISFNKTKEPSKFEVSSGSLFQTNVPTLFNPRQEFTQSYQIQMPRDVTHLENFRNFSTGDSDVDSSMTDVTLSDIPTPYPSLTSSDSRQIQGNRIQIDTSLVDKYRLFGPDQPDHDFERVTDQAWSISSSSKKETKSIFSPMLSQSSSGFKQQGNVFRGVTGFEKRLSNQTGNGDQSSNMYEALNEPVEANSYGSKTHDETVRWLLEKYRNLDIKYDTSSLSDRSLSLSKESLEFTANNEDSDQQPLGRFHSDSPLLSVHQDRNTKHKLGNEIAVHSRQVISPLQEAQVSVHSLDSTKISDFDKASFETDSALLQTASVFQNRTLYREVNLPEVIEIQGEARNAFVSPNLQQDITIVTPMQTPLNQDNTGPVDATALYLESTQPFTPETISQSPEKFQSTPYSNLDEPPIASVSLNSSLNSLSSGSKASFTVVDGDEIQTINLSQSRLDSGYTLVSDATLKPLKQEKCLSPLEKSSEESCSNVITPVTASSAKTCSTSGSSAGSKAKTGSMVSITPEVDPETTLTEEEKATPQTTNSDMNYSTPLISSERIERNMNLLQHFDNHFQPTIESAGTEEANDTINSERSLGDRVDDQLAVLSRLLNRSDPTQYLASTSTKPKSPTGSVDTLEPKSAVLITLPHSRSESKLEEMLNKEAFPANDSPESVVSSTVSTLFVVNKPGSSKAKLESVKPFVGQKVVNSLEQKEIATVKLSHDTTQSSLGLLDIEAADSSLNSSLFVKPPPVTQLKEHRIQSNSKEGDEVAQEQATSADWNLSPRNWAQELSQFKLPEGRKVFEFQWL